MSSQDKINELLTKLESLQRKQDAFSKEITALQKELEHLKTTGTKQTGEVKTSFKESSSTHEPPKGLFRDTNHRGLGGVCSGVGNYLGINRYIVRFFWVLLSLFFGVGVLLYLVLWIALPDIKKVVPKTIPHKPLKTPQTATPIKKPIGISNNLEKFIGENLISKIGIIILVIGVSIGVKYSIENNLISPLTRIILGYLVGLGLLVIAMRLQSKFENFSVVLVSGAMAILYFITYAAYGYYTLMPQPMAFSLMFIFTVFTVFAALKYNKQFIAHIGLVGAYAIPFLLSNDLGNVTILFSYTAIINMGILVLSFKKYWKPLYYVSFVITWLMYCSWYVFNYQTEANFMTGFMFAWIFFIIFYITFLAYKLIRKESFETPDIILLLANSFIFYGFGYGLLDNHETGSQLLGLFTLCNAIIHFIVGVIIFRLKLADKNLFYFVAGLVLVFITITIPVQLDGNWVTLLWVGEAALLFWIGRTKAISVYESMSYPLMILAVLSLYQDWFDVYSTPNNHEAITPVFNSHFLSTALFIATFVFIYILNINKSFTSPNSSKKTLLKIVSAGIPVIIISTVYFGFYWEIDYYFQTRYETSELTINHYEIHRNYDVLHFKTVWLLIYSLAFMSVLSFLNIKKFKNYVLGHINIGVTGFVVFLFLLAGLFALSQLRENYINNTFSSYYHIGAFHIIIRYIAYAFLALALFACYKYIQEAFMKITNKVSFIILFYVIVLWLASSELINIMDLSGSTRSYKLGLSILWGMYSLLVIVIGIWKKRKYLRIGAIVLFSITLIKLFFYDISHLTTLSKTIVFVALGVLLLTISFLYNKFKHNISDEVEN